MIQVNDLWDKAWVMTREKNVLWNKEGFKLEITDPAALGGLSDSFKAAIKVDGEEYNGGRSMENFIEYMQKKSSN